MRQSLHTQRGEQNFKKRQREKISVGKDVKKLECPYVAMRV